jgi:hypothetical protein
MVERSLFWDTELLGDGGPYTQTHIHDQFFRSVINGTGDRAVVNGWRGQLLVSGTSSPLTVAAGGGCVYGMLFDMDEATTVDIPTPSTGASRYDIVCLRRDWASQTVRVYRHPGVAAGAPVVPTLTQTAGTYWEAPLATVLVDDAGAITVTDSRDYCTFSTEWPANIVTAGMFEQGSVTVDKIPNRTRYFAKGGKMIRPDATNPCAWVAGPTWDYFTFTNGVTNSAWTYWMGPTGLVGGQVNFYIWNAPTAVAAGDVKWDYNIYHGDAGTPTNTTGTVPVIAQGGRAVGTIYRDQVPNIVVPAGPEEIISFQLSRDGGAGADTYGSPVWLIGVEMEWTADS